MEFVYGVTCCDAVYLLTLFGRCALPNLNASVTNFVIKDMAVVAAMCDYSPTLVPLVCEEKWKMRNVRIFPFWQRRGAKDSI